MRTSPFVKHSSNKDVHFLIKKSKEVALNAHYAVTSIFPNSGDVPHSIRLYSALFYLLGVSAVFIYLLYTGYKTTLDTQFLSPYLGNNARPDANCALIPISYTGNFQLSDDGYWEGSKQFSYNRATYQLTVTAYSATSESFRKDMTTIYNGLQASGESIKHYGLEGNLLFWMSLVFVNQTVNAKRLTLTGTPLVIVDRDHTEAAVSSIAGNCNISNIASFDKSSGMLSVSWVYADFIAEPLCMKAMDPVHMGYNLLTSPKMFTLAFDIRSIVTGIAVNLKIVTVDQLVEITKYRLDYMNNGRRIIARYFYDPYYDGMQPLRCVTSNGGPPFCTFRVNDVVMFPIFRHIGANLTSPEVCDCTKLTAEELSDKKHNCNVFRFVSGFSFLSGTYPVSGTFSNGLMTVKYKSDVSQIFLGAHRAMFIASTFGQNSPLTKELNSPTSLAEAYEFCNYLGQTCSILTFTSYDIVPSNWAVSDFYKLVMNGACTNTITPSAEAWARAIDNPYGPLVQNYQQCGNDAYTTLLSQAGIAVGNIQVVAPLCVIFLMLVVYLHKWWHKVPLDESYSKATKDSALDAYAMSLLLARDEKLKTAGFRGNNSIIALIAEELGEHTFLSTLSHKNNQSAYSMSNLSTHSLNSVTKASAPPRRLFGMFWNIFRSESQKVKNPAVVVPANDDDDADDDVEMGKVLSSKRGADEQLLSSNTYNSEIHKDELNMSMREWIVAKKRGSLGDDGNGLHYAARRESLNAGLSGHHQPVKQGSENFDAALNRVMQLEPGFGKGPASFAVQEGSN